MNDDIFRTRDIAHDPVILPRPNSASEDAAVENLTPLETPTTGMTVRFHSTAAVAPLQIVTRNSGVNYLVKIEDWESEATALTVFVRGGETASVDIPVGLYRIKYAAGRTWYGLEFLFGQGTDYFVAESQFRFEVVGNEVRGYTIELYLQKDGNLSTKKIDPEKW